MTTADPPTIVIEHVSKTFPGQRALIDVSFTAEPGRVHALLGQNGSGKSTLIKILAGYHEPDPGGSIRINGLEIERDRAASAYRMGLRCVHQQLGLIDEFNAVENFGLTEGYPSRAGRIDWDGARTRADALLQRIGVKMDLTTPLGKCAPVERTAVAVARAVCDLSEATRGCLVLDEPTAALAKNEVEHLFGIIAQLTRQGISVIYVTHRLDEVFDIANDVTTLRSGRVVATRSMDGMTSKQLIGDITGSPTAVRGAASGGRSCTTEPALRVSNLVGLELQGISFDVFRGEILGVAGLLGSGRSELPYLLTGHNRHTAGDIQVKRTPDGPARTTERRPAFVPSDRLGQAAIAGFSVRENMTLADLRPFQRVVVRRAAERDCVRRWCDQLEIRPDDPERNFTTLSGGNQQKVVLAKWLNTDPSVLVLDEATAGVDVGARAKIYSLLREQVKRGLAIVACSSDLDELAELADRVIVLREGQIVAELRNDRITAAMMVQKMTEGDNGDA